MEGNGRWEEDVVHRYKVKMMQYLQCTVQYGCSTVCMATKERYVEMEDGGKGKGGNKIKGQGKAKWTG